MDCLHHLRVIRGSLSLQLAIENIVVLEQARDSFNIVVTARECHTLWAIVAGNLHLGRVSGLDLLKVSLHGKHA